MCFMGDFNVDLLKINSHNESDKLTETHNQLREELEKKCERTKKGKEEHIKLQCEVKALRKSLKTYEDNISEHKTIIARLENEVKKKHENSTDENNAEMKTVRKFERIMRENLDQVEKNLKESLFLQVKENNKQINEKLNEVLEQNKTFADAVKTVHTGNSAHW